ncbi:hypothetical protein ISCGN_019631 [Ixodes scapularis]
MWKRLNAVLKHNVSPDKVNKIITDDACFRIQPRRASLSLLRPRTDTPPPARPPTGRKAFRPVASFDIAPKFVQGQDGWHHAVSQVQATLVLRPSDHLNLSKHYPCQIHTALRTQAALAPADASKFMVRVAKSKNLAFLLCLDSHVTQPLQEITSVVLEDRRCGVTIYPATPSNTCKGVIHNFPAGTSPEYLMRHMSTLRPEFKILAARMMGRTTTALITFHGTHIPHEICYAVASSAAAPIAPRPNIATALKPDDDSHTCSVDPVCLRCGGPHRADDAACKDKQAADAAVRQLAYNKRIAQRKAALKAEGVATAASATAPPKAPSGSRSRGRTRFTTPSRRSRSRTRFTTPSRRRTSSSPRRTHTSSGHSPAGTRGHSPTAHQTPSRLPSHQTLIKIISCIPSTLCGQANWRSVICVKKGHMIFLPKPGKSVKLPNFRPTTLTSHVGKVMERMVLHRLQQHLQDTEALPHCMIGYRSYLSTQDTLLRIHEEILQSPSTAQLRAILAIDVTKAFDYVHHDAMFSELADTQCASTTLANSNRSPHPARTRLYTPSNRTSTHSPRQHDSPTSYRGPDSRPHGQGSKSHSPSSPRGILHEENLRDPESHHRCASPVEAELLAIALAAANNFSPGHTTHIYTDSKSACSHLAQGLAFRSALPLHNNVRGPLHIHWIPGHAGVAGNERAHQLAREKLLRAPADACDTAPVPPPPLPTIADSLASRCTFPPPHTKPTRREQTLIQAQTYTLHAPARLHLCRRSLGDPLLLCSRCLTPSDLDHLLWDCPHNPAQPHTYTREWLALAVSLEQQRELAAHINRALSGCLD